MASATEQKLSEESARIDSVPSPASPPHTHTESTLAATPEYERYLLLFLPSRYILRGANESIFDPDISGKVKGFVNGMLDKLWVNKSISKIDKILGDPKHFVPELDAIKHTNINGAEVEKILETSESGKLLKGALEKELSHNRAASLTNEIIRFAYRKEGRGELGGLPKVSRGWEGSFGDLRERVRKFRGGVFYDWLLGLGSLGLTISYTNSVYKDIQNMFCETVALELGKDPGNVTFSDISNSDNKIVGITVKNFWNKAAMRFGTDLFFFTRPIFKGLAVGDIGIGIKAFQALNDTWKHKSTMFEDLVTFVNSKINPRNGLGQPITSGEVFDLYQHYADAFHPDRMFTTVVGSSGRGEHVLWAKNQPVFDRMAKLMNDTYAYKHRSVIGPDGHAIQQADFALPKFIYLLGHDLIDAQQPERTLLTIELANIRGIPAVKDMIVRLNRGETVDQVAQHYHITLPSLVEKPPEPTNDNGMVPKEAAADKVESPATQIKADTAIHDLPLATTAAQLASPA